MKTWVMMILKKLNCPRLKLTMRFAPSPFFLVSIWVIYIIYYLWEPCLSPKATKASHRSVRHMKLGFQYTTKQYDVMLQSSSLLTSVPDGSYTEMTSSSSQQPRRPISSSRYNCTWLNTGFLMGFKWLSDWYTYYIRSVAFYDYMFSLQ